MSSRILDKELQGYRLKVDEVVKSLHEMTLEVKNLELAKTVSDLRDTIREPFLFVIVGEVKAGKSSFINALLATGKEVCKVAPDPCTDTIQQVMYGAEENRVEVNPYLHKISLPVEILREISVVDTPGTNTIIEHHQEITEKFIPGSDLIVFVFEAKNPYRQSAWDFFNYIHKDWQKKVIFVLQQSDLLEPDDLVVNIAGVTKFAEKKGILSPNVFAVSAKAELNGDTAASGFNELNAYIKEHITGGKAASLKLISTIGTAHNIASRIHGGLEKMELQLKADRAFRVDVLDTLRDQEERSNRQIEILTDSLLLEYDQITQKTTTELSTGLNFFSLTKKSFLSVFSKQASPQEWLTGLTRQLESDLTLNFNMKLNEGVENLADSIQQMARIINLKIQNNQTVLKGDSDIFGDIADKRRSVLRDLQEGFTRFMHETESFVGREVFPEASTVSPNIAAGSGIAVIGLVLAAVTQGMVLDVTGGIFTTLGLLFAGGTVIVKRGKIMKGFRQEIARGRKQMALEVDQKLKAYVNHIKQKIDLNFAEFDALLEEETQHITKLSVRHQEIVSHLDSIEAEINRQA